LPARATTLAQLQRALGDSTSYADVVFRHLKLVIEIDGRFYHTGAEVFEMLTASQS
jgi:hypothetical protein